MPQANVETRTALMTLQEDLEQSQRYSVIGHIGVLTGAVLSLNDQAGHTNERLDHIEADLAEVKQDLAGVKGDLAEVKEDLAGVKGDLAEVKEDLAGVKGDLAGVKGDLAGVKTHLGLLTDEVRVTGARVERLVQYIIRDEKQED